MIYLNDIHNVDDKSRIAQNEADMKSFLEDVAAQAFVIKSQADSMRSFGIYTEDAEARTGNALTNLCKNIGNKIMEIIQKAMDFVSGIAHRIAHTSWTRSSNVEKFQQIARKNPKAAEQVKIAVAAGELDFMSYSDFADFYKNIDKILAEIKTAHADPKTIRGKWQKLKHKYLTAENIRTAATVIGTVVTATVSIITIVHKLENDKKEADKLTNTQSEMLASLRLTNEELVRAQGAAGDIIAAAKADKNYALSSVLADIASVVNNVGSKELSGHLNLSAKLDKACGGFVNATDRNAGLAAMDTAVQNFFGTTRAQQNMRIHALTSNGI